MKNRSIAKSTVQYSTVWSIANTAHSDFFVFFVRLINTLTYLLTYLLTDDLSDFNKGQASSLYSSI